MANNEIIKMTKMQKVWLWIFGAMFLIPEILWSPILNFIYSILVGGNTPVILRNNFLVSSNFRKLAISVILFQCIGAFLGLILIMKISDNKILKIILSIIFFIFFIISLYIFIILSMVANF